MQPSCVRARACRRAVALLLIGRAAVAANRRGSRPRRTPARTRPCPRRCRPLLPTVNIAPAVGWPQGETPTPAAGFAVNAFATGLEHPRWLYVLPNGDVLVAETNGRRARAASSRSGARSWARRCRRPAPACPARTASRCCAMPTATASPKHAPFPANLMSPFGMALVGDTLYVANADAVVRVPVSRAATRRSPPRRSRSPTCRARRATTTGPRAWSPAATDRSCTSASAPTATSARTAWTPRSTAPRCSRSIRPPAHGACIASGLRNPVGMAWHPQSGALWTVVNERDELGSDLVPDYLTSVREGAFYGWPYSYFGPHVDTRVQPPRPDLVATAIKPDYALGAHVAPLGLAFYDGNAAARALRQRRVHRPARLLEPRSAQRLQGGVRAVRRRPAGRRIEDVLTGFLDARGQRARSPGRRRGRPARARCWWPTMSATSIWRVVPSSVFMRLEGARVRSTRVEASHASITVRG